MELHQTVQTISDDFHIITDNIDALVEALALQLTNTTQVRRGARIDGLSSQRTLSHLADALLRASEMRKSLTLAHAAAEKEAVKAELPWDCPPDVFRAEIPRLRAVRDN